MADHNPPKDPSNMDWEESRYVRGLTSVIMVCVRCLALLMVLVIVLGVVDVALTLYENLIHPPFLMLDMNKFLDILGSFLAVMVGLEIFMNIVFYLKRDAIHVPLVLSTALTAIARKVIVLDYSTLTPAHIYATGIVVFAVGFVYWLISSVSYCKR